MALAGRIARLSATFRRTLTKLGITPGSPRDRSVSATVRGLANAEVLPGPQDILTKFPPGRAHVRRVPKQNMWILYRFDTHHVELLTVRAEPPEPTDDKR